MEKKKGAVRVYASALVGVEAQLIEVEVDQRPGLTNMTIVGLPDKACGEAKERIRSALRNCALRLPQCHVVFNLAPAELPKSGSGFDIAMAVALMVRREEIPESEVADTLFLGELALDGKIRAVTGVLAAAELARRQGLRELIVPQANAAEATLVDGLTIRAATHLQQLIDHLSGKNLLPIIESHQSPASPPRYVLDFSDIHGQTQAKRALEIAAAGGHHVLLSGPPGSGKSMLAKAVPSILPPLDASEIIELTKIYSAAGLLSGRCPRIDHRPWRNPHHSASAIALVGGGSVPKPGEISLAHRGVLFLDEIPEFPRAVLDHLRQPLENGVITVSRSRQSLEFPARFLLLGAMNPCPCGYATDEQVACRCLPAAVLRYQQRLSGPFIDRFDLFLDVPRLDWRQLTNTREEERSEVIAKRVHEARERQRSRAALTGAMTNQELSTRALERYCELDDAGRALLQSACKRLSLSNRAYYRVLRVARTIADLAKSDALASEHIAEALQYRRQSSPYMLE